MKKSVFFLFILVVILISCSPTEEQIQEAIEATNNAVALQDAEVDTPSPSITATLKITFTPYISKTPKPTNTDWPTKTPNIKPTNTPKPEPIVLSGSNDSIVDLDKWNGPAIAKITYQGSSNFVVKNYGTSNEYYDLLVNTIGSYSGTVPIDFLDSEQTTRFEVKASGPWEITVLELTEIRIENIPGIFTGSGDDVIYLHGSNPDKLIIDASNAKSNFVIWSYGSSRDLLVNEIAPYTGTVLLENEAFILVIKEGGGVWSLEVETN